ncbi:hypothetical protein RhiirA4_551119, partial [Rhizophagus irregularis]
EQDDNEITTLLQDYIKRKSNREVDKSSAISTIGESSSSAISAIDERPVINESSPVAGITSIGEIFNSSHEIQRNEGNINAELNLQTGSREIPKTRGSYKCRVCNGIGHNAAFHKSAGFDLVTLILLSNISEL